MEQDKDILIGYHLQKIREKKGLSLEDVFKVTKIRPKILKAIETHNISSLPHETVLKGMLHNYCQFLDVKKDLTSYHYDYNLSEKKKIGQINLPKIYARRFKIPQFAFLLSCFIIMILFFYRILNHEVTDPFMTHVISYSK